MFLLSLSVLSRMKHACLSHLKQLVTTEEKLSTPPASWSYRRIGFLDGKSCHCYRLCFFPSGSPSCSSLPLDLRTHTGPLETESVTREFWTKGVWGCSLRRCTSKEVKGQDWADAESDLQCINSSCWGPSWSCGEHWILPNSHEKAGPLKPHISCWAELL